MKGENIMNYDINIREEVFGGTLMDVKTGKRVYITKKELKKKVRSAGIEPETSPTHALIK